MNIMGIFKESNESLAFIEYWILVLVNQESARYLRSNILEFLDKILKYIYRMNKLFNGIKALKYGKYYVNISIIHEIDK